MPAHKKYFITKQEIKDYLEQGLTYPQIAEQYKCSKFVIARKAKEFNLCKRKTKPKISKLELESAFISSGKNMTITAALLGSHMSTIRDLLDEYGIERPKKSVKKRYNTGDREPEPIQIIIPFDLKVGDPVKTQRDQYEVTKLLQGKFLATPKGYKYNTPEMFLNIDYTHLQEVRRVI